MKKGFTLVELLAVVLIVGILTSIGLPQYRRVIEKSHAAEAESMLRIIYDSGERLAGEFGARSYQKLWQGPDGAVSQAKYSFKRFDMFDENNLPRGCDFSGDNLLVCPEYSYRAIIQTGPHDYYVAAKKLNKPFAGLYILLDPDTLELYCQPSSPDKEDECDVLGLDVKNVGLSF